jgi:uncharacterized membrane protein YcaP (DUF421 family)
MEIAVRAVAVYGFLWFFLRVVGKRELSALSPLDLVVLVVTGDLVQQAITQDDMSVTGGAVAISTMGLLAVATSWWSVRSQRAASFLEGQPVVFLRDGVIDASVLRRERISLDEVRESARGRGIADLGVVRWGILETDGGMSFVPGPFLDGDDHQSVV